MSKLGLLQAAGIVLVLCTTAAIAAPAQTFNTLVSFDGTNGADPYAGLVQGTDGNFYGTTYYGGASGDGTVFKITPAGTLTSLYSFCSETNCTDGASPYAGLIQGTDGNFYGTTYYGGANKDMICSMEGYGCGTIFKMTPSGTLTTLYSFCSQTNCADGYQPTAGLIQASNGNFYGTTSSGGAKEDGTVFEITSSGALTTLHSFSNTDGAGPVAALVQASNGNFYGTTSGGANGGGTVFKITPAGTLTTLYSFCPETDCTDGEYPWGGLIQASDGNFYGTTSAGGANSNGAYCTRGGCGTVFEITSSGKLTTLYSFCSETNCTDGAVPYAGLIQATDGDFYGTTYLGGNGNNDALCPDAGCGTIFQITSGGTLTTLYRFCPQSDCAGGANPYAGLIQASNGNFYGTTSVDGPGSGTVFSLAVGLGPFVETRPTSGKVGTKVIILGNNLKGTTSVAFNGTAAAFKVVSDTEIKTSVPNGATTGYVTVTTPKKKLKSNVVFRVTK